MVAPMDTIISAAMYHDIAAMTIKGQEHNKVEHDDVEHALTCPSEGVYHSKGCSVCITTCVLVCVCVCVYVCVYQSPVQYTN